MSNNFTHVKNPLTVIAIFSGISEVSGTAILPILHDNTQKIYIWFIMIFPSLLVLLFFWTLFFRSRVLYAPSDFKDENIFASLQPASPHLRAQKLEKEMDSGSNTQEDADHHAKDNKIISSTDESLPKEELPEFLPRESHAQKVAQAAMAEDLVITYLADELKVKFIRNVSPISMPRIMFDAFAKDINKNIIVSVKYIRNSRPPLNLIYHELNEIKEYIDSLSVNEKDMTYIIFAIILDGPAQSTFEGVSRRAHDAVARFDMNVRIKIYNVKEHTDGTKRLTTTSI